MFNFEFNAFSIIQILLQAIIVLFSLTVHEVAHGYAAYKLGDPTARNFGRLTLNPLKHLDPMGAICMLLFRFGWAKPVPINTRYFKKPKRDMALSAAAGPLSNLIMALIAYIISAYIWYFNESGGYHFGWTLYGELIIRTSAGTWLYLLNYFFDTFFILNISLAVFNLIPIPPLDGSRVLYVLLPDHAYFGVMKYERHIQIALFVCLWLGLLDGVLNTVVNAFEMLFRFVTHLLPLL